MKNRKIFFIGDTHFFHKNIIKYANRPLDHQQRIINNWNSVVSEEDIIFHLGDVSFSVNDNFSELKSIFSTLKGEKILIRGNHDTKPPKWFKEELGFSEVYDYLIIEDILLSHYPLKISKFSKEKEIKEIEKMKKIFLEKNLKKVIHGHIHQYSTGLSNHFNASVEVINYCPIEINEIEFK